MPFWTQGEVDSLKVFNVTYDANDETSFSTSALSPITVNRKFLNEGTEAAVGELNLKREAEFSHDASESVLKAEMITVNPGGGSLWMKGTLQDVLGIGASNMIYAKLGSYVLEHSQLSQPSQATLFTLKAKSLYYFMGSFKYSRKCLFDDDCGASCAFSSLCEPMSYGHHGLVMPSAELLMTHKVYFELGNWPRPAWNWKYYCQVSQEAQCHHDPPVQVTVFDLETLSRRSFLNTGTDGAEVFPDLKFQVWKSQGLIYRKEYCGGSLVSAARGKDCDAPAGHVFVGPNLFLSGSEATIASEKTTGLRLGYKISWQLNYYLQGPAKMVPLFSVDRTLAPITLDEKLQFSSLADYPAEMLGNFALANVLFVGCLATVYVLFFYGMSCFGYCGARGAEFAPFKPVYI
jgi:hypothetical protein